MSREIRVAHTAQLVAHGAVVQRNLVHRDRALRTGYVEALAVDPAARRRGTARP